MRMWHLIGLVALQSTCFGYSPLFAAEPSKPIAECENEFVARKAALKSQGVSTATFFHECWWHSSPGQPTAISFKSTEPRTVRTKEDHPGKQRRTGNATVAQASRVRVANASEPKRGPSDRFKRQRAKFREASLRRRLDRNIVARARRLVLEARNRRAKADTFASIDTHRNRAPFNIDGQRLAMMSRRDAKRRERIASERKLDRTDEPSITNASVDIPANAIEGRRSWIETSTAYGTTKTPAVIIGPLRKVAVRGSALHCWDQNVLFLAKTAHWQQSLVCDGQTQLATKSRWFDGYAARL